LVAHRDVNVLIPLHCLVGPFPKHRAMRGIPVSGGREEREREREREGMYIICTIYYLLHTVYYVLILNTILYILHSITTNYTVLLYTGAVPIDHPGGSVTHFVHQGLAQL
jgi:hypothetical protein